LTLRRRSRVKTSGAPTKHVGSHFGTGPDRKTSGQARHRRVDRLQKTKTVPQGRCFCFCGADETSRWPIGHRDDLLSRFGPRVCLRRTSGCRIEDPVRILAHYPSNRTGCDTMSFSMKALLFIFLIWCSNCSASVFVGNSFVQTSFHGALTLVDLVHPSLCRWHLRTGSWDEPE
jgi:hypothetical protein